jgi:hypothetical protein
LRRRRTSRGSGQRIETSVLEEHRAGEACVEREHAAPAQRYPGFLPFTRPTSLGRELMRQTLLLSRRAASRRKASDRRLPGMPVLCLYRRHCSKWQRACAKRKEEAGQFGSRKRGATLNHRLPGRLPSGRHAALPLPRLANRKSRAGRRKGCLWPVQPRLNRPLGRTS